MSGPVVTDADREAVKELYDTVFVSGDGQLTIADTITEAFARHRTTAEAASAARVEELEIALKELCAGKAGARPRALRALAKHQQDEAP